MVRDTHFTVTLPHPISKKFGVQPSSTHKDPEVVRKESEQVRDSLSGEKGGLNHFQKSYLLMVHWLVVEATHLKNTSQI